MDSLTANFLTRDLPEPRESIAVRVKFVLANVVIAALLIAALFLTWDWKDALGFLSHPARAAVIVILALKFAANVAQMRRLTLRQECREKRVREAWFFLLLFGGLLGVLLSPFFDRRLWFCLPGEDLTRYAGLALFVTGMCLATWAQTHMGRFFSGYLTLQNGHRLITDGPFARIRHPRYAGGILALLGFPMVFLSQTGLAAGCFCAALLFARIPREERMMAGAFGEEWERYATRTKRLVPGIY